MALVGWGPASGGIPIVTEVIVAEAIIGAGTIETVAKETGGSAAASDAAADGFIHAEAITDAICET
jgi:hypothetical protein